ncbi:hypothetical protein AB0I00_39875 [Streptomyces sp. NPDC050803]|uniref:hypothetical protein n=1 Tax=unclassified Streptomyces TaxID=2593676 RepID=UPI00343BAAF5
MSAQWRALAERLQDRLLPGGGTARLSMCGVDDGPRLAPRGEGERGEDPQLALTSWGFYDPGPKGPGEPRFTVRAAVRAGERPLLLDAPLAEGRVTLDFYGPHGEGRRASVRGLTATVVDGSYQGKPVDIPASGSFRVGPGQELLVEVDLPAGAVCPGHSLRTLNTCSPEDTNDVADCPVLALTLADPAIRAYRARMTDGGLAGALSDRLVAVSLEPHTSRV